MNRGRDAVCMGQKRKVHKISIDKLRWKKQLGRRRQQYDDNIKIQLKEKWHEDVDRFVCVSQ
jgi:hypothetical protein